MSLTETQLAVLEDAAKAWEGTPFCEGAPKKGLGVCCQHLVGETLIEAQLMPRIEIPSGPTNWRGQDRSLIAEWLDACPLFARIGSGAEYRVLLKARQPADVLGFRVGGPIHHLMLQLHGDRVFHSLSRHRACIAPAIPGDWETRLAAVWRLKTLL